jgi:hypothetical protein
LVHNEIPINNPEAIREHAKAVFCDLVVQATATACFFATTPDRFDTLLSLPDMDQILETPT